jgi:rhodanese-related sulfurtransferase
MSIKTIPPAELKLLIDQGRVADLIDVRTPMEFAELHAAPARLVPLDQLDPHSILSARNGQSGEPIYLICRSGSRGGRACERFLAAGFEDVVNVEGGTLAWEQAGLPVVRGRKVISLERQVRIVAGAIVLVGAALGWLVHPGFFGLCAFVGAGLVFAGVTDFCGMGLLLARMPWNRLSNSTTQTTGASCQA